MIYVDMEDKLAQNTRVDRLLLHFLEYIRLGEGNTKNATQKLNGDDFMNRAMEEMISRDLGLAIKKIRTSSWDDLDKIPRKRGKAFRPKDMFLVGGNINLAEYREMGMTVLGLRNIYRKVKLVIHLNII